ncbi:MAG: glycosyltransferase [Actinomycetota bacterium]
MSRSEPLVSVLALAYDHERFVEESLDAVAAQTFRDFELVIVDDCSTDSTGDRIRSWLDRTGFDATFIANERNLGVSAARNVALERARGTFVCTAAGDDVYEPDRLEHQVAYFTSVGEEVAAIFGDMRVIDEDGTPMPAEAQRWSGTAQPSGRIFDELLRGNFLPSPATMLRRSAVEEVGGWDAELIVDDWDLFLRLADRYELHHLPGVVANYRQLDTGISRDRARAAMRSESVVRLQMKWSGRDDATRRQVADRAWRSAMHVLELDRTAGQRLLSEVLTEDPTWSRRLQHRVASTPLAPLLVRFLRAVGHRIPR